MEWMLLPLKRYAQFSGRSRRKEFWMYILFIILANIVLSLLDTALGLGGVTNVGSTPAAPGAIGFNYAARTSGGLLAGLFALGTLVPTLAVSVRRLHDTNRSGWWLLLPLVPYALGLALLFASALGAAPVGTFLAVAMLFAGFVCGVLLLVWYCLPATRGTNRFGSDPLGGSSEEMADSFR